MLAEVVFVPVSVRDLLHSGCLVSWLDGCACNMGRLSRWRLAWAFFCGHLCDRAWLFKAMYVALVIPDVLWQNWRKVLWDDKVKITPGDHLVMEILNAS